MLKLKYKILIFVLLIASAIFIQRSDFWQRIEYNIYDLGTRIILLEPSNDIHIITIDQYSLDKISDHQFSLRNKVANMIEKLANAKAKVIGVMIPLPRHSNIDILRDIADLVFIENSRRANSQSSLNDIFVSRLINLENKLDPDKLLANSIKSAGNVVLPIEFELGEPSNSPDIALPTFVKLLPPPQSAIPAYSYNPITSEIFGKSANGVGHINAISDFDELFRSEHLAVNYFNRFVPALSLVISAKYLNIDLDKIKIDSGGTVILGTHEIHTVENLRMNTYFYREKSDTSAFQTDSFYDIENNNISLDKFKGKIVLIGITAPQNGYFYATPILQKTSSVQLLANNISNLLLDHSFTIPSWAPHLQVAIILLVIALSPLLLRFSLRLCLIISLSIIALLISIQFFVLIRHLIWINLIPPAILLAAILLFVLSTSLFFHYTKSKVLKTDEEVTESNRMLGLAFQGQGQLDMAFDKFRKCPMDGQLMENIYNLALDFERKRQFNKAEAVFRYMFDFDPKFRDLEIRLNRAKQLAETVVLGGGGRGRTNSSLLDADGNIEKPMLGRYQIEKMLGKGAMGAVYMGRDPKINRIVAIKIIALAQEFDEDELADVKERLFREAESAGRLNHPNIVTMFDAGEEHDLAYIAMEFLKGKDLVPYAKASNLMPLPKVMSIVARVAEALSYAHENHVVHRDIKPANIMYEPESDIVKITDFGLSRITDSSKTKTGMVLGTPSYMSPEQLAGKHIDGRSDLFSLGITLFQLSCGKLPFYGDSMAELALRISHEPHPDIRKLAPVPNQLADVINKALDKNADNRYQTGSELCRDLRCIIAIQSASEQKRIESADIDIRL